MEGVGKGETRDNSGWDHWAERVDPSIVLGKRRSHLDSRQATGRIGENTAIKRQNRDELPATVRDMLVQISPGRDSRHSGEVAGELIFRPSSTKTRSTFRFSCFGGAHRLALLQ